MPFRRLGTISSDPATVSPWISGQPPGSVAGCNASTPAAAEDPLVIQSSSKPAPPTAEPASDRLRSVPAGPSFLIRGSQASQPASLSASGAGWSAGQPRLDRINSAELLRQARQAYYIWLSNSSAAGEPLGIVLNGGGGRVVFELPILLPAELFVPIEWLRPRASGRSRGTRSGAAPRPPF